MQNICGTEPHPAKFRAKKYKIQEKSFSLTDFRQMMSHLPERVPDQEITEMFEFADRDGDGRISYDEFLVMITPVKAPESSAPVAQPDPQPGPEEEDCATALLSPPAPNGPTIICTAHCTLTDCTGDAPDVPVATLVTTAT